MGDHNVITTSWILKTREDRFSDEFKLQTPRNSSCGIEEFKIDILLLFRIENVKKK